MNLNDLVVSRYVGGMTPLAIAKSLGLSANERQAIERIILHYEQDHVRFGFWLMSRDAQTRMLAMVGENVSRDAKYRSKRAQEEIEDFVSVTADLVRARS